jgi:dihydrodipicolinate synthase/N-acetylneuraminate lyase
MQQALASGDAESARQIQLAIANLNAAVQREGYGVTLAMDQANRNANTVKGTGA